MLLFNFNKISKEKIIQLLLKEYKHQNFKRGSAHWTGGLSIKPSKSELNKFDILIDKDLNVHRNKVNPEITKKHTYQRNALNLSIAICGMSGLNSYIWYHHRFDENIPNMISYSQFEILCFLFAFFQKRFNIPLNEIKTIEEYAKESYPAFGSNPAYPNGYYPHRFDLDELGYEMRKKIQIYQDEAILKNNKLI